MRIITAGDTKGNFGVEKVVKSRVYHFAVWSGIQGIRD